MSAQEIIRIANELAAKGITPSTAMVKARLSQPVPMAELLKVLSQWKQQPASAPEAGSTAQMVPAPAAEPTPGVARPAAAESAENLFQIDVVEAGPAAGTALAAPAEAEAPETAARPSALRPAADDLGRRIVNRIVQYW